MRGVTSNGCCHPRPASKTPLCLTDTTPQRTSVGEMGAFRAACVHRFYLRPTNPRSPQVRGGAASENTRARCQRHTHKAALVTLPEARALIGEVQYTTHTYCHSQSNTVCMYSRRARAYRHTILNIWYLKVRTHTQPHARRAPAPCFSAGRRACWRQLALRHDGSFAARRPRHWMTLTGSRCSLVLRGSIEPRCSLLPAFSLEAAA